ncbi:MAG: RNA polymerase sigma factor [Prevotellaceae bacterium]|jgi:RNA polymerase sigma factor (sigma-70 family)|nr:RNA polymerase sigma factor [Prevotellaceae bacterium]
MKKAKRKIDVVKVNRDNLEKLIVEYRPQLKSFIRKRVDNREDAEDILQDVFYQLTKTVNAAINPIEEVAAWLYRVARNTIINHGIKKREEAMPVYQNDESEDEILADFSEVLFNSETSPSPETEYLRSLVWEELEAALAELPPEQREIFELTELDGIPVKGIAQTTGVPVNTLLSRKHYAVLHLRKRIRQLYEDIVCQ